MIALNWSGSMFVPQRSLFVPTRNRLVACLASGINAEQLRTQLDHLHSEADEARAKANRARLRLLRLSEAAEKLQRQALTSVQTGRENDARDLLVRKKNVMHALENLKSRIDLFDKLSAKLNEAISLKESQLVNAVTVDFVDGEEASAEVHIVPPKEETAINTEESKESDANFLALGYDRQSEADPGSQEEESSHNDTKIPDGISIGSHQSEANLVSRVKEISSYEDFLGHLDQQLNNIETELNMFLMFSTMISEGGEKLVNLKLQQTGEILEGVCRIRKRIASIKQTKNVDQIENSSSEVNYSQVNSSKLLET